MWHPLNIVEISTFWLKLARPLILSDFVETIFCHNISTEFFFLPHMELDKWIFISKSDLQLDESNCLEKYLRFEISFIELIFFSFLSYFAMLSSKPGFWHWWHQRWIYQQFQPLCSRGCYMRTFFTWKVPIKQANT